MPRMKILVGVKGGPGSGNYGHAGRPGMVGGSSSSVGGSGNPGMPSKEDVQRLSTRLRRWTPSNIRDDDIIVGDQVDRDPDLDKILDRGELLIGGSRSLYVKGKEGQCHWNVCRLYEEGKIDSIMLGYTQQAGARSSNWYQHTWGVKDGRVVETTPSNKGNMRYYGFRLSDQEAATFVDWTSQHAPGSGVVRRVQ